MQTKITLLVILLLSSMTTWAELVCAGSAYGIDSTYSFAATESKDLSLVTISNLMGEPVERKGTAKYSSTVKMKLFEKIVPIRKLLYFRTRKRFIYRANRNIERPKNNGSF